VNAPDNRAPTHGDRIRARQEANTPWPSQDAPRPLRLSTRRAQTLEIIRTAGRKGAIADDIAAVTDMHASLAATYMGDLREMGLVERIGYRQGVRAAQALYIAKSNA
jgi:hypothetical protein